MFALYRLPDDHTVCYMQGEAQVVPQGSAPGEGFIMAPFCLQGNHPTLIIRPTRVSTGIPASLPSGWEEAWQAPSTPDYAEAFCTCHEALRLQTLQKVVLSHPFAVELPHPLECFRRLCDAYPHSLVYLACSRQAGTWVGATPEILLHTDGQSVHTMALAGTNFSPDAEWDDKNREEQALVARFIRQTLQAHCDGIRETPPHTMQTGQIFHLCTRFEAKLRPDADTRMLTDELHPTPAVCGLPKDDAMRFILQHEHYDRQYYAGYVGPMEMEGLTSLYVNIRCARFTDDRHAIAFAGSGLLAESTLDSEWEEIRRKARQLAMVR